MRKSMWIGPVVFGGAAAAWLVWTADLTAVGAEAPASKTNNVAPAEDPAIVRTRETTQMLDALYKNYVVSITQNYVEATGSLPAALTSKPVFAAMEKGGFHSVRLVDGTGKPVNPDNAPKDAFEKAALAKIVAGAPSYEEVETKDGKRFLRTATVVPVVMKQCIICHPGKKMGDVLGALVYRVPVK